MKEPVILVVFGHSGGASGLAILDLVDGRERKECGEVRSVAR